MVAVDAYSKYPEVVNMLGTTVTETIKVLREIFSRHGLPETIVSDNGPQFTSEGFRNFCEINGISLPKFLSSSNCDKRIL